MIFQNFMQKRNSDFSGKSSLVYLL